MGVLKTIGGASTPLGAEGEYKYMVFCGLEHAESYAENHRMNLMGEDEAAEFDVQDRCQFCGKSV